MDTKAYIESGIIESYVLGLASAEEAAELQKLSAQHAEIKNAVNAFEALVEAEAFENAVLPPAMLKQSIMQTLATEFAKEKTKDVDTPIVSMADSRRQAQGPAIWRYLAAASIIFLIASTALNFYFYNNFKSTDSKYQALLTQRNSLQASNGVYSTQLDEAKEALHILQSPDMLKVKLPGTKGHETDLAVVYWNSKTKDVYVVPSKMEPLPAGKQYQLWALVDGKPVDAGVMGDCKAELCSMRNIPNAQGFAITIEPAGGSTAPHLDAMVVFGTI